MPNGVRLILGELGCHMSYAHGLGLGRPLGGLGPKRLWESSEAVWTHMPFPTDICQNRLDMCHILKRQREKMAQ